MTTPLQKLTQGVQRLRMKTLGFLRTQSIRTIEMKVTALSTSPLRMVFILEPKLKENTLLSLVRSYIKSADKALASQIQSVKFNSEQNTIEIVFKKPDNVNNQENTDEPNRNPDSTAN